MSIKINMIAPMFKGLPYVCKMTDSESGCTGFGKAESSALAKSKAKLDLLESLSNKRDEDVNGRNLTGSDFSDPNSERHGLRNRARNLDSQEEIKP